MCGWWTAGIITMYYRDLHAKEFLPMALRASDDPRIREYMPKWNPADAPEQLANSEKTYTRALAAHSERVRERAKRAREKGRDPAARGLQSR